MARTNPAMRDFVKRVGSDEEAGRLLGLAPLTIRSLRKGVRPVQPKYAEQIEVLTEGEISRVDLVWPKAP